MIRPLEEKNFFSQSTIAYLLLSHSTPRPLPKHVRWHMKNKKSIFYSRFVASFVHHTRNLEFFSSAHPQLLHQCTALLDSVNCLSTVSNKSSWARTITFHCCSVFVSFLFFLCQFGSVLLCYQRITCTLKLFGRHVTANNNEIKFQRKSSWLHKWFHRRTATRNRMFGALCNRNSVQTVFLFSSNDFSNGKSPADKTTWSFCAVRGSARVCCDIFYFHTAHDRDIDFMCNARAVICVFALLSHSICIGRFIWQLGWLVCASRKLASSVLCTFMLFKLSFCACSRLTAGRFLIRFLYSTHCLVTALKRAEWHLASASRLVL